ALADLRGERMGHRVVPTPSGLGPQALLSRVAAAVKTLMREADVPRDRLLAVAAGAPGAVDPVRGVVVALAPNLKGWSDVPMAEILGRALEAPVVGENDVNLAVLGERWQGAAQGHDNCVFISLGTGIGAGVIVGGALHRGQHFGAGEIGLMCMGPQFVDRDFGPRGCLETLAGLRALSRRWPRSARDNPERWIAALVEAARHNDRRARKAVEEVATLIGIATANLSLVVDPSLVVLGGAVAQGDLIVEEIRRIVSRIVPLPIRIVVSALGKEAPLWGSLLVAINEARGRLRQSLRAARGVH